jgi:RimJ/RimL family protein N-acetyltransferase
VNKRADVLETRRLVLRRPTEDDIVAITALADNISVASKLLDMPHPYTIADAWRLLRRLREQRDLMVFAITEIASGTLIGCGKIETSGASSEARVAFWIGEPHWNRSYGTEAGQALIDHAFALSPQLISIRTSVRVAHPAAKRVLEKCGFQYVGPGAETDVRLRCLAPIDHYRIDRGVWSAIKAWSSPDGGMQRLVG